MENQSGHRMKILRIDTDGKYVSNEFLNLCKNHGIQKQFIAWYTPQHNGITERKNRTIMEMAHIMIAAKHFPNEYSGESVATSVYILNRCLTKSVKNKVPQEAWKGMNHSVSHLKYFGCVAYAHILDELRKKLDKKGQKCIFIGYSEDTKAYKLNDPVARKVIISRDVQFFENESWDGTVENNVKIVLNVEHEDMTKEVVQTPKVNQPVTAPSTPMTP